MTSKETIFSTEQNWRVKGGILAATGALALLSGCSGDSEPEVSPTTPAASAHTETHSGASSASAPSKTKNIRIVFDALGGGDPTIRVYPGVTTATGDKQFNGTYDDGDDAFAECKLKGRTVHSDTSVGEEARTSNDWVRIANPNVEQYATAVYIEKPDAILKQLENCPAPQ